MISRTYLASLANYGALIFSATYTVFYFSYVARHFYVEQGIGISSYYDLDAAMPGAIATLVVSALVSLYLSLKCREMPASTKRGAVELNEAVLFVLSFVALLFVRFLAADVDYEGLHSFVTGSWVGKLLYVPYLYFAYILINGIKSGLHSGQVAVEFVGFLLLFSVIVPMRSQLLTLLIVLAVVYRPGFGRAILASVFFSAVFVVIAITRAGGGLSDIDEVLLHLGMYIFGPSLQVDLYELAVQHQFENSNELYSALMGPFGGYFESGGGFGSFINLELRGVIGPYAVIPNFVALFPLLMAWISRRSNVMCYVAIVSAVQCMSIIRNPISSWFNGFCFMLFFLVVFHVASRRR